MDSVLGELAALTTALCYALSSTLFTVAGRRFGAPLVNRSRLFVATAIAMTLLWILRGAPLPFEVTWKAWTWLGLSGVIGLAMGDGLLFRAYVLIGPALSMLIFALSPALAVVISWIALGETLTGRELLGIGITLTGIAWVVAERRRRVDASGVVGATEGYWLGVALAFGGALGQAGGLVTAKVGLGFGAGPLQANVLRLTAAALFMWATSMVMRSEATRLRALTDHPRAAGWIVAGAVCGPILGVWLSLVAIERVAVGIASTLMSLTPLFLLPVGRIFFGEPVTRRAVLGTVLALVGVALLLG